MKKTRILVTGADGQLGRALQKAASGLYELFPVSAKTCDVTEPAQVIAAAEAVRPDVIIHCAAYTSIDRAETERELCRRINVEGTKNAAVACEKNKCLLILLSTDYVFDGNGEVPWEVDAPRAPLNQYGRSKVAAEDIAAQFPAHCIVRTSWMFGDGNNFVKAVNRAAKDRDSVDVVDDQIGSPTYSEDLAPLLLQMAEDRRRGVYHATNEGWCSWADLAEESFRLLGVEKRVHRVTSEQYGSAARRPHNSRLSKASLDAAGYSRLPHWKDALERYIRAYGDDI